MKLSRKEINALRARWPEDELAKIAEAVLSGRLDGIEADSIIVDGVSYTDLRGIRIHDFVRSQTFERIDFSYSRIEGIGGAEHTVLRSCRLCGIDLNEMILATSSTDCDLSYAKFHSLSGTYTDCKFIESNLSRVQASGVQFIHCDFTNANLYHTHALRCEFENCIWDGCKLGLGSFAYSRFRGTMPTQEQLGETIMDDVIFEA